MDIGCCQVFKYLHVNLCSGSFKSAGDELQAALFPDTAYRFESGGTPRAIPDLTYEQFLEEHRRHYRLDNSYLTLYGDLDLDGMLAFLDERYLSPVADEQAAATGIGSEGAPLGPHELREQAPVRALGVKRNMATAPENADRKSVV